MTNVASSLLDFILDLFRDPEAAAAFREDPQQALADAGLADVSPEEVHDLMPMVAAYSPGHWNAAPRPDHQPEPDHCDDDDRPAVKPGDHHHDDDPAVEPAGHHDHHDHHPVKPVDHGDDDGDKPHHHAPAAGAETTVIAHVQNIQVTHVENTFTYVDVDIDASHGIWASGDADVIFGGDGDDAIVAGDGIALSDDAELDNEDGEIAIGDTTTVIKDNTVIEDSVIIKDNNVAVGTEGPVAQDGSTVEHEDNDTRVDIEDSQVVVGGGQIGDNLENVGNDYSQDNDTRVELDQENVGNDYSEDNDVTLENVGNDYSEETDVEVELENVGNDYSEETDVEVELENLGNDYSEETDVDVELAPVG
jgi:hypothetical protein